MRKAAVFGPPSLGVAALGPVPGFPLLRPGQLLPPLPVSLLLHPPLPQPFLGPRL